MWGDFYFDPNDVNVSKFAYKRTKFKFMEGEKTNSSDSKI